jgi:hypothetical protein
MLETEDQALLFDVRFALLDVPIPRTRAERSGDSWRQLVAEKIVSHLRLANWIIKRGPPTPGHK